MALMDVKKDLKLGSETFQELKLTDLKMFNEHLSKTPYDTRLWSMNFVYTWTFGQSKVRKAIYKLIDKLLCVFNYDATKESIGLLYLPFGDCFDEHHLNDVTKKCFIMIDKVNSELGSNKKAEIREVTDSQIDWLNMDLFTAKKSPFGFEYVYNIDDVVNMQGKDYEYIRRKINKFVKNNPSVITRRYEDSDYARAQNLKKEWKDTAGEKYFRIIDSSYYDATLKNCSKMGHDVFIIEIDKRLVAIISGGILHDDMAWCFMRKPLNDIEGLSEYAIHILCKEYQGKATILEDGGDGNSKGLRFFKERFRGEALQTYGLTIKKGVTL